MSFAINRRTFITGSLVTAAGIGLATTGVCAAAAQEAPLFGAPGTYTGTGLGRNGEVNVTVTLSDSAIEGIEVQSSETMTIGAAAMEKMAARVVETQSTSVDMVSGATFSSVAFIAALSDAIRQADCDEARLSIAVPQEPVDYVTEADLIVVGGGGAGLIAALKAADQGASVIVIDKAGITGGNTNAAATGPNCAGSKVQEELGDTMTVDDFRAAQLEDPLARPELVDALVDNSGEAIDWLHDEHDIKFKLDDRNQGQVKADTGIEGRDAPGTGQVVVKMATETLEGNPDAHIYLNVRATELVVDGSGRVTGVVAETPQGEVSFAGKAVLLSAGGYGFNPELFCRENPELANCGSDEASHVTGDAILMAEQIGAQIVDISQVENSGFICTTRGISQYMGEADCGWMPEVHRGLPAGFFVNKEGIRFTNETELTRSLVLEQTDGYAFHIFPTERIMGGIERGIALGVVFAEDTPEALADKLGITNAAALADAIAIWNKGAEQGEDLTYGRDDEGVIALGEKCRGYAFQNTIHYCMGGVLIDPETHVLDLDGNPIAGLYAAGETTGGVHGSNRRDGSGIADSFIFGYIAGRNIANEIFA